MLFILESKNISNSTYLSLFYGYPPLYSLYSSCYMYIRQNILNYITKVINPVFIRIFLRESLVEFIDSFQVFKVNFVINS
jgi:hypothetical protein